MSAHPNVILKCTIKARGTTRELLRTLLAQNRQEIPNESLPLFLDNNGGIVKNAITGDNLRISRDEDEITIGDASYGTLVMEETYDDEMQISGEEGDLILYDLVTYGYGEDISWRDLQIKVDAVETWAIQHGLTYKISISANYW